MKYEVLAASSVGRRHIERNMICQDAVSVLNEDGFYAAAAADGHGSSMYFRSDRGSKFAAEVGCKKMIGMMKNHPEIPDENDIKELIAEIVAGWRDRVKEDVIGDPFVYDETRFIPTKYARAFIPFCEEQEDMYDISEKEERFDRYAELLRAVYGSTLVCAGACENYWLCVHIGDGKCVAVYDDGTMDEPVPWDDRCYLNVTTSICDDDAEGLFRHYLWMDKLPAAVFLNTDGIDNSLEKNFHSFYRDVAENIGENGIENTIASLCECLPEITERGCGDDVSIAVIADMDKLKRIPELLRLTGSLETENSMLTAASDKLSELKYRYTALKSAIEKSEENGDNVSEQLERLAELEEQIAETGADIAQITARIVELESN